MSNQDSVDIIKANQNLESYQKRILELESENVVLRAERSTTASQLEMQAWRENADLKRRVAELEQRMIDQANMILKKSNENEELKRKCETADEDRESARGANTLIAACRVENMKQFKRIEELSTLCKSLAGHIQKLQTTLEEEGHYFTEEETAKLFEQYRKVFP